MSSILDRLPAPNGLADYARQAVMLLNFVMPWSERRLDTYDRFESLSVSQEQAVPVVDDAGGGRKSTGSDASTAAELRLGQLKTEARVSWSGMGTQLQLHLSGAGYALPIGAVTHMALAYFDGRTTAREAAHTLAAAVGTAPEHILPALLDLRVVLLDCGYLEPTRTRAV